MRTPYLNLTVNLIFSAIVMYLVMFAMIDAWADFYNNLNMLYMALMMLAPMAILMIITMPGMYPSKRANVVICLGAIVVFMGAFGLMRMQGLVGDTQFLRSMIPHHSGAILMCREAQLEKPGIKELCDTIIKSQQDEIRQMEALLVGAV
ncbi:DUF305 domain-containing protein [Mesorhizobium sp. 1M-11]|uniref:DUF305 domain-containing protein n=1 Tax=Mesorhizobium sp. 1M-11 TaxID=1529006 RepID=UPI0006C7703C|nr:DUF305 domain-containing protein [Mesorhizobium sp. 1M-11]